MEEFESVIRARAELERRIADVRLPYSERMDAAEELLAEWWTASWDMGDNVGRA